MGSPFAREKTSTFSRMFSKTSTHTARAKTYLDFDLEHSHALVALKERITAAGLEIPPQLLVNGDLDATLYRFLRARKYNVDLAFAMLQKSLHWRKKMGADTILEQPIDAQLTEVVRACRPSSYIGYDDQHHPIFLERLGKLDGRRMEREGVSDDALLAYHLREMEFMAQVVLAEASAAAGHTVDRIVSIMDAQGLTLPALTGFAQRLFRLITAMDSDNYPECCHTIYIVNAGATFGAIWRLVSPFVDKGTRDKVQVIGSGKNMQSVLFGVFGQQRIPSFLGGTLDYEVVRRQWLNNMDAAMADGRQHPKGHLPPVRIQPAAAPAPAAANGHHPQQHPNQQQSHSPTHPARSSHSGPLHWLKLGSAADRAHSTEGSEDGWATPLSAASRFSAMSGASVYYDAQDQELPSTPSSPAGGSPSQSPLPSMGGAPPTAAGVTAAGVTAVAHSQQQHMDALHPQWPESTAGSMSVGPQSRTRSQLSQQSGFTAGLYGHSQGGHGMSLDGIAPREDSEVVLDDVHDGKQPHCGCRCVIS